MNWKSTLIPLGTPIIEAVKIIGKSSLQVALVVDQRNRLLGTITDGDIRRGILNNISMEDPVDRIMNKNFTSITSEQSREATIALMKSKKLCHIPVIDGEGCITDLKVLIDIAGPQRIDNWVVLMAGGLGTRLKPLTDNCPKPLLKVGGRPIIETILMNFRDLGFYNFFISVNYKKSMISDYLGDGSKWGVEINYLYEPKQLGTAGSLSLLPERPSQPIFVMNCDLLTKVNFRQVLDFHISETATATMCVRKYDFQIPYGVVKAKESMMLSLEEKPVKSIFVNAGIYVIDSSVIDCVPKNGFFNMTSLFDILLEKKKRVKIFPVHEYWIDIGKNGDYEQANGDYCQLFKD